MKLGLLVLGLLVGAALGKKEEKKEEKKAEAKKEGDEEYKTPKQKRLEKEFKQYLEVEQKLVDSIKDYVDLEKKRLEKLKNLAANSEELKMDYIYNPVNVFKLIKRLVYSDVFAGMHENSAEKVVGGFKEDLPSEESLRKAAVEVFRWQDKNDAKTKDLANGDLPDEKTMKPLTIDDCFHLGRMAYNDEDYYHAALWFEEAWQRILLKKNATDKEKVPILDYLSFCYYRMGNLQRAYWMTVDPDQGVVKLDPENSRAKGNIKFYETEMEEQGLQKPKGDKDLPEIKYLNKKEVAKRDKEMEKERVKREKEKEEKEKKDKKEKKKEKKDKKDKKKKDKTEL